MKSMSKKITSLLLICVFLLSVAVGFTSCGKQESIDGVYEYDSVSFPLLAKIAVNIVGPLSTGESKEDMVDMFLAGADTQTIEIISQTEDVGRIIIKNGAEELYSSEYQKDSDKLSAVFGRGIWQEEREYVCEKGYLTYLIDSDGLGTIKVKYKKVQ